MRREIGPRLHALVVGLLLLALTLVGYGVPLAKHFWGGVDEHAGFQEGSAEVWSRSWDTALGRPTLGWVALVSRALTPDSLDGFVWTAVALCWLNAWLLWAIVRRLAPGSGGMAAIAAILLVVCRSDASRFYVLWTADFYGMALFLFLTSFWLLLLARGRRSPVLLAASCMLLAASLLTSEGLFPLAAFALVAIWWTWREGPSRAVWAGAWLGTIGLLAARFVVSLSERGSGSYQSRQVGEALGDPGRLWEHAGQRLKTFGTFFEQPSLLTRAHHLAMWLPAFGLASVCVWLACARDAVPSPAPARGLCRGVGLGFVAFLLGAGPFLHLNGTFRTMFFGAPGQAVAVAFLLGLVLARVAPRVQRLVLAAGVGLLAAGSATISSQAQADLQVSADVRLERTIRIYDQVRAVASHPDQRILVLFVLEKDAASPLSPVNYAVWYHAEAFLHMPAYQAGGVDPPGQEAVFTETGVTVPYSVAGGPESFPYERVVAFQTASDGSLSLLRALPARLLPAGNQAGTYAPLAHLSPGPLAPLHHLRSRYAAEKHVDVIDSDRGIIFTGDWLPLEIRGRAVSRWARNGAGIVVNAAAAGDAALEVDVEPGGLLAGKTCELKVTNSRDEVVAQRPIVGRQTVRLSWPMGSGRLETLNLWLDTSTLSGGPVLDTLFRVALPDAGPGPLQGAASEADIFEDRLTPAGGWQSLVLRKGRNAHRHVRRDAALITGLDATRSLELALDSGASRLRVRILDDAAQALASFDVSGRQTVLFPLARSLPPGSWLRIHWDEPGADLRCYRARCNSQGD